MKHPYRNGDNRSADGIEATRVIDAAASSALSGLSPRIEMKPGKSPNGAAARRESLEYGAASFGRRGAAVSAP